MRLLSNEYVTTRDGIALATDVYLPDGPGPWPVVVERTPYGKTLFSRSEVTATGHKVSRREMAQAFTDRRMAVVYQDCRGRYDSQGEFEKYVNEAYDGYDTYAWIIAQEWCDGSIGSMGLSYAAHTQLAAAGLNPPGLKTMVLDSGGFDNAYRWGIRQGGAFELKQATWAYKQSRSPEEFDDDELRRWFYRMPWSDGASPLTPGSSYESYLLEQWRHGEFDDYWKRPGLYNEPFYDDVPDIPILFLSSWYDVYVPSTIHNYQALGGHHLIMGPWLHGDRNEITAGDASFGPQSRFDGNVGKSWLDYRLQWFEDVLVNHTPPTAGVRVFEMGGGSGPAGNVCDHGGRWVEYSHWPPPESRPVTLFFAPDNQLAATPTAGQVELMADPGHPVPTVGGQATSGKPIFVGGAFNQIEDPRFFATAGDNTPLIERGDVLYFDTEPLEHDVVVAGSVEVTVTFIADGPDFDIAAKLADVSPNGHCLNITDSIKRARYRDSYDHPTLVTPGEIGQLTVTLPDTCNRFAKGHRIRIMLAGSNFPHFDVNPNSGEAEGSARSPRVARTQVLLGQSSVTLSILGGACTI